jgi:hypothetical protein
MKLNNKVNSFQSLVSSNNQVEANCLKAEEIESFIAKLYSRMIGIDIWIAGTEKRILRASGKARASMINSVNSRYEKKVAIQERYAILVATKNALYSQNDALLSKAT